MTYHRDTATSILGDISDERAVQERLRAEGKFPHTAAALDISDYQRLAILIEEVGEAAQVINDAAGKAWREGDQQALRKELVQVAAVAVAWLEALDEERARGEKA